MPFSKRKLAAFSAIFDYIFDSKSSPNKSDMDIKGTKKYLMAYQALFYHHLEGVYDTSMCIVNNKERIWNSFSMNPSPFNFFYSFVWNGKIFCCFHYGAMEIYAFLLEKMRRWKRKFAYNLCVKNAYSEKNNGYKTFK